MIIFPKLLLYLPPPPSSRSFPNEIINFLLNFLLTYYGPGPCLRQKTEKEKLRTAIYFYAPGHFLVFFREGRKKVEGQIGFDEFQKNSHR